MLPILYSFRRCPYAMRARLTIQYSGVIVELREVMLRDMPASLLEASPKATVPVLVFQDETVIDESRDIMQWALQQNDPDNWLGESAGYLPEADQLININDDSFKYHLDRYKYADRYPEHPADYYRTQAEDFLQQLERRLKKTRYLLGNTLSVADIGIFPFIRQFAFVDKDWFDQTPYRALQTWLNTLLASRLFTAVMHRYPAWKPGDPAVQFPAAQS